MFFAQYVLSKKGPLAKIWLAAHWEKKLTKAQVYETNIDRAIESILDPKVKMALRTTGHLLLGIVKIHSRKTKYLLADCNEAFLKIKMAFRPGMKPIDVTDEQNDVDALDVTSSEVFRDLDSALPDLSISHIPEELAAVQGRYEQITMKESVPMSSIEIEDDFGESSALRSFELARDATTSAFDFGAGITLPERRMDSGRAEGGVLGIESPLLDDGFGGPLSETGFEAGMDLFDTLAFDAALTSVTGNGEQMEAAAPKEMSPIDRTTDTTKQMTTLLTNDEEAFVLEPVDATISRISDRHRLKRKRRLLVDSVKNIPGDDFKAQLTYDKDTVGRLEIGPFTKELLRMRETGSFDKLWNSPSIQFRSSKLSALYAKTLTVPMLYTKEEYLRQMGSEELEIMRAGEESTYSLIETVAAELPPIQEEISELQSATMATLEETETAAEQPSAGPLVTPRKVKRPSSFRRTPSSRSQLSEESAGERALRWTRKSQQLLNQINNRLKSSEYVTFKALTKGNDRKTAAQKFYSLLELQKWNAVNVEQSAPFGEIRISRPDGLA